VPPQIQRPIVNKTRVASPLLVHGALLLVALLFGINYVAAKLALREVGPRDLVVIRTAGAAGILFVTLELRRVGSARDKLTRGDLARLFLYSLLGASINQLFFLAGLARSTATNASIMVVLTPLQTMLFAVLLRRERATMAGALGIVIGLGGALLLILPRGGLDVSAGAATGNLLLLISGASYALYLVFTRSILARVDAMRVIAWVFLFAALTVLPFDLSGLRALSHARITTVGYLSIAYVVLGGTVLAYVINAWALARIKSSVVAVYIFLQPMIAATLGRIVLHERLGGHTALAGLLIASGVVIASRKRG
jgi:drug/metabolite transporter (DMT)-like permease